MFMEEHEMRRSKAEVYLHLVWATCNRQSWLTPERAPQVYYCIIGVAEQLGCTVLALGGMPDHVHLAVRLPTRTSIAQLAQQIKSASSKLTSELNPQTFFRWQEGYAVFSLSSKDLPGVIAYIKNQERHHALTGKLWPMLEETDEEVC